MDIRFDDYNAYPNTDIRRLTKKGITLSTGLVIDYAQCAANYQAVHGGSGKCVGERNVSERTIIFYTAPLTTHLTFVEGNRFLEFFRLHKTAEDFHALCDLIEHAGYTTCDEG